jgi:hypothetical protein
LIMDTPTPISILPRSTAFGILSRTILTLPYGWSGIALILGKVGWLAAGRDRPPFAQDRISDHWEYRT